MVDFEKTVNLFLVILEGFQGNPPQFSMDYHRKKLTIHSAPSGFLKKLYAEPRFMGHLDRDGLSVEFFKERPKKV